MHHHDNLIVAVNAERRSGLKVEKAIVRYHLDFEIVIARPQRA